MSPDIDPVDEAAQDGPDADLLSAETQADPILGLSEETRRFDLRELFQGAVKACLELVLEEELRAAPRRGRRRDRLRVRERGLHAGRGQGHRGADGCGRRPLDGEPRHAQLGGEGREPEEREARAAIPQV